MFSSFHRFKYFRQIHSQSFIISKAAKGDKGSIQKFMEEVFYKQDPSSVLTGVAEKARLSFILTEQTLDTLGENSSFVARQSPTDSRIVGVAINGTRPAVIEQDYTKSAIDEVVCEKEKKLLEFWQHIAKKPKNAKKIFGDAEKIFEIRYLAVHPASQRRGIAKALTQRSIQEAEELGFKFLRMDCTSAHTARLAKSFGMKCIYRLDYSDYKDSTGCPFPEEAMYPHTTVKVFMTEMDVDEDVDRLKT